MIRTASLLALLLACCAFAETLEFRDAAREPLKGRVLVEFPELLFVAVDGGRPQFVARGDVARIVDQGGVSWVDPAPGTFARALPGAPRAALTDTTLEVRVVQRGHRLQAGNQGPVFLFEGDRADCEGVARLTLVDGTALTLGAASQVRIGKRLELLEGEARVAAGPSGGRLAVEGGRAIEVSAEGVARIRAGTAAYLYVEQGSGAWRLPEVRVSLQSGQGAEALSLARGVRLSADPTNADALQVEQGPQVFKLFPGESLAADARVRGWALREPRGSVRVQRGAEAAPAPVALVDRDRVRLSGGDTVTTGAEGSVAVVRSGTVRLGPEGKLRVGLVFELHRGAAELELPTPVRWAFGARQATLLGRAELRRTGEGWRVEGRAGGTRLSTSEAYVELLEGEGVEFSVSDLGWSWAGAGVRVTGAEGWVAELPEVLGLTVKPSAERVELSCAGRRVWQVSREAEVWIRADGRAEFANGAQVALRAGGVAQIDSNQVAAVNSRQAPGRLTLANGARLEVRGSLQLTLSYDTVRTTQSVLKLATGDAISLDAAEGHASAALLTRGQDRLELPRGPVHLSEGSQGVTLRVGERTLRVDADAPPTTVRVASPQGDLDVQAQGLRGLRFPARAGGTLHVSARDVRWIPK